MRLNRGGFTIFETMIVMAVSSLTLVATITAFSGRQAETQFRQGIKELESVVRDIINDVAVGYYPPLNVSCSYGINGPEIDILTAREQGTNYGCIYLGKAIHWREEGMDIYTIIGNRTSNGSNESVSYSDAKPVFVPALTYSRPYPWGMKHTGLYLGDITAPNTNSNLMTFVSEPTASITGIASGSEGGVNRFRTMISGTSPDNSIDRITSSIPEKLPQKLSTWTLPESVVTLCFRNPNNNRLGGLLVNPSGNNIEIRAQNDSDKLRCEGVFIK